MKALVLAGGSGTRLRPITHTTAKQLVPVGNRPVLFHCLDTIAEAGITDVGIVVGDTREQIQEAVGDGSRFGLSVTYIWQKEPLGLAHAVQAAQGYLGDDDFLMYLGDNVVLDGVTEFVESFRARRPAAQLLLTPVDDPTQFGVAEVDGEGRVTALEEKPLTPKNNLAVVGVYLLSVRIHEAIGQIKPSLRGELEITDAIQWCIEHGHRVQSETLLGGWKDTGNASDMLVVNRWALQGVRTSVEGSVVGSDLHGEVVVEPGARVVGSQITGPVVIGPGSEVMNSQIGPFVSISDGCHIKESWIMDSIIMSRVSISGIRPLEASLIGSHVKVSHAPTERMSHRLVLGDRSSVSVSS